MWLRISQNVKYLMHVLLNIEEKYGFIIEINNANS